ncbi:MAG TPA: endonuclease/exonuclease/phosphatase family protein, partial [Gammaproteobacteria bacterium]
MLTVMTQNLNYYANRHGAWPRRRELLCDAIRDAEPDVVALQAVCSDPSIDDGTDQATQLSRALSNYPYVFFYPAKVTDAGREEGSAIISRIALHEPTVRELSLRKNLEDNNPRVIQHARFDLEKGALNVFNAYFSWVEEQAADNIAECVAFLGRASGPALLVGDFNIPAGSILLRQLEAAGFTDLWLESNP